LLSTKEKNKTLNIKSIKKYSDKKNNNEEKDSWSIFRPAAYLDLDYKFGPIVRIKKWNNRVYFWQDKAFGLLPINQRALIQDQEIGQLQLGVSGILDYYQYITENQGMKYMKDLTRGDKGLYWYDSLNKEIVRFNGESVEDLSVKYKINSYIKALDATTLGTLGYDKQFNEVLFKVGTDKTLVFNEVADRFISFYTYHPEVYIENEFGLYYIMNRISSSHVLMICLGAANSLYNKFNPTLNPVNSTISITDSDNFLYTKAYDNIRYYTEAYTSTGYFDNSNTFNTLTANNSYQYIGNVTLTVGSNVEKREREYVLATPRNIVNAAGTTNIDIYNVSNHLVDRTFKERLRDKYISTTFTKTAPSSKFAVYYINFEYRLSKR
jgi:hypothetical protein